MAGPLGNKDSKIASIRDGTSNTFMFGERLGGSQIYQVRTEVNLGSLNGANGGGWADFLNGDHWLAGALYDGTMGPDGGPCAINCTNLRSGGFYSFHPTGAQFAFCDGGVSFVAQSVDASVFASCITREKQEVVKQGLR
jgi:prepilin-type processing-associated H-X9-DG protein